MWQHSGNQICPSKLNGQATWYAELGVLNEESGQWYKSGKVSKLSVPTCHMSCGGTWKELGKQGVSLQCNCPPTILGSGEYVPQYPHITTWTLYLTTPG
mmetsp:Transcript_42674/g.76647  ORF Transcript_42674/g.76647 Transcript_42674/m.76647 type:complete len:99 (-) Transcript_42674:1051-1347(-)